MNYIKFEPAKFELCKKNDCDKFYLFYEEKILIKLEDYSLPCRKDIEDYNILIKYQECIALYNDENCYTGTISNVFDTDKFKLVHLREYIENVEDENQFQLASRASMLKNFRDNNKVCSNCGSTVIFPMNRNDRVIKCVKCNQAIWPTNSPAVIVAVIKNGKILLAKNKNFGENEYSVIAGFLDLGETFEDCVKREVLEEVGIRVKNIKYFGSQPWAFPNSMMTGFIAEYESGDIEVDNYEILDAKWFSKSEILKFFRPTRSIGSMLISSFLNNK